MKRSCTLRPPFMIDGAFILKMYRKVLLLLKPLFRLTFKEYSIIVQNIDEILY